MEDTHDSEKDWQDSDDDEDSDDWLDQDEVDVLEQALNYNWPSIQQHLIEEAARKQAEETGEARDPYEPYETVDEKGTKTLHVSADSWWLKDFRKEDVIVLLPGVFIFNTKPFHRGVISSLRSAYGLSQYDECDDCFTNKDVMAHIERFPLGQFAAQRVGGMGAGHCVGMATTMRSSRPPTAPCLPWLEAIGDMKLSAHEPDGDWLYGVEMAIRPMYQGHGIGSGLYAARFALAKYLNLRGMYAVGMLMGYRKLAIDALQGEQKATMDALYEVLRNYKLDYSERDKARDQLLELPTYADLMDVREYGERVSTGEFKDPTVTMQMNRGFRPVQVVADYCDEPAAGNAGLLIVWDNPDYQS